MTKKRVGWITAPDGCQWCGALLDKGVFYRGNFYCPKCFDDNNFIEVDK